MSPTLAWRHPLSDTRECKGRLLLLLKGQGCMHVHMLGRVACMWEVLGSLFRVTKARHSIYMYGCQLRAVSHTNFNILCCHYRRVDFDQGELLTATSVTMGLVRKSEVNPRTGHGTQSQPPEALRNPPVLCAVGSERRGRTSE